MANNHEQEKEELDKKIDEKLSQIREDDGRLSSVQSKGFQLGSFYLVFQGVILTAIANANSVFGCLSYWLLIALSSLASFPNLIAMYHIGGEYIRISFQRDISLHDCDSLFTRLAMLSAQNPTSSSPGTSPFVPTSSSPGTPPFLSAPTSPVAGTAPPSAAGTAPSPSPVAAIAPPPPAGNHGYTSRTRMRIIFVSFCIAFYLSVSAIMYFVCIKTLRKPGAQCKQH